MCLSRYFEFEIIEAYKNSRIKSPIYLSIGDEGLTSGLSMSLRDYHIFAQHRSVSLYIAFGGNLEKLRDELLGLSTGCSGGIGGSPMIQDYCINMIGHNGLIGENVPIGVGFSLASGKKTLCYFGDGAVEEDYVFPSVGFAATHKLPVLFVCADNNLSILTPKDVRRNWNASQVAKAYGMHVYDASDNPFELYSTLSYIELPAFINCRVCRHNWHTGIGTDGLPDWDILDTISQALDSSNLTHERMEIEREMRKYVYTLWK
jgi:acetoin:2,6-dichlorophenolindophenol oxidoreductase subunit alpha